MVIDADAFMVLLLEISIQLNYAMGKGRRC